MLIQLALNVVPCLLSACICDHYARNLCCTNTHVQRTCANACMLHVRHRGKCHWHGLRTDSRTRIVRQCSVCVLATKQQCAMLQTVQSIFLLRASTLRTLARRNASTEHKGARMCRNIHALLLQAPPPIPRMHTSPSKLAVTTAALNNGKHGHCVSHLVHIVAVGKEHNNVHTPSPFRDLASISHPIQAWGVTVCHFEVQ